jgi:hypothetical protein
MGCDDYPDITFEQAALWTQIAKASDGDVDSYVIEAHANNEEITEKGFLQHADLPQPLTLEGARRDLAAAQSPTRIATLVDGAEAMRVLALKIGAGLDEQNNWCEYKLDAERTGGAMLDNSAPHGGDRRSSRQDVYLKLPDYGIAYHDSKRWRSLARIPESDYRAYIDETRSAGKEITEADLLRIAKRVDRDQDQRRRQREQADIAPEPALITLASYEDWLPTQPDCDLLLTDPLYLTDVDDIDQFANEWLPQALAKVKSTGRAYICIGSYPAELRAYLNIATPKHLILDDVLGWTYRNTIGPQPTYGYKRNWQAILYYRGTDAGPLDCPLMVEQFSMHDIGAPTAPTTGRWHTWQKPDTLAERFIRHATQPGDLVLDPFTCTGTFILAAARLGRQAYGCEIDPDNLAIAIERGCQHV